MQNQSDIPQGLPLDKIMKFAATPQGQSLLAQLQQQHSKEMDSAIAQAQAGDYSAVKQSMASFLSSPAGQELMQKMRGLGNG